MLPAPRFVRVRDVEHEWRVVGFGLAAGRDYDVSKRDGSTARVRITRVTSRRPNGALLAKFVALRRLEDGLFEKWCAEDDEMEDWMFREDW